MATTQTQTAAPILPQIDALTAKAWLDAGTAALVDIREPAEFARERIPGARLLPAARLAGADLSAARRVIFHCKSGARTLAAAPQLAACGAAEIYGLKGGIEAWRSAGLPTLIDRTAPIDLMRQVQIAAGALILIGALLGVLVHPGFFGLSAFVGAGLLTAGLTGFCGMARLLALMPWNRVAAPG
jgi:rhodanese-related sulfurtransferase